MTETLAHGYMTTYMIVVNRAFLWLPTVWMIFIIFCIFVHWTKITSVSEGLTLICWWWLFWQKQNDAKNLKNERNPHTSVLIWEYSARAFQWIPTRQGLDGFQKSLGPCDLDKNILGIGRVDPGGQGTLQSAIYIQPIYADCNLEHSAAGQYWWLFFGESRVRKIFEGEMLTRTLSSTLLHIFCKIVRNSQVTVKSIIDVEDNL